MNSLTRYLIMRAKPRSKPLRTMRDKRKFDDHLLNWSWLYAAIMLCGIYGYDYLTHVDKPELKMSMELRK